MSCNRCGLTHSDFSTIETVWDPTQPSYALPCEWPFNVRELMDQRSQPWPGRILYRCLNCRTVGTRDYFKHIHALGSLFPARTSDTIPCEPKNHRTDHGPNSVT